MEPVLFIHPLEENLIDTNQFILAMVGVDYVTAVNHTQTEFERLETLPKTTAVSWQQNLLAGLYHFFLHLHKFEAEESINLDEFAQAMQTAAEKFNSLEQAPLAHLALAGAHFRYYLVYSSSGNINLSYDYIKAAKENYAAAGELYDDLSFIEAQFHSAEFAKNIMLGEYEAAELAGHRADKKYKLFAADNYEPGSPGYHAVKGTGKAFLALGAFFRQLLNSNQFNFNAFFQEEAPAKVLADEAADQLARGVEFGEGTYASLCTVKVIGLLSEVNHIICNGLYQLAEGREVRLDYEDLWKKINSAREFAKEGDSMSAILLKNADQIDNQVTNTKYRFQPAQKKISKATEVKALSEIQELVKKDRLQRALEAMLVYNKDTDTDQEIIKLLGRLKRVERKIHQGDGEATDNEMEYNKVREAVGFYLEELS